jgi:hypothetical protein
MVIAATFISSLHGAPSDCIPMLAAVARFLHNGRHIACLRETRSFGRRLERLLLPRTH